MRGTKGLAGLLALAVLAGCSGEGGEEPREAPAPEASTPTAEATTPASLRSGGGAGKGEEAPAPKRTSDAAGAEEDSVPAWEPPTDGQWDWGDVSFGEPTSIREAMAGPIDEYVFTISEPPTFELQGGGDVKMTSSLHVERVHDRGFGETISEGQAIWFQSGPEGNPPMSETYGTRTDLECEEDDLAVGETTTCTVSFVAPQDEIPDAYWIVNGSRVGAWPSQQAED